MENLVEDNGICDCHYLLTMRLALQREVDSPFGINSIYDLGDWCAPWWRKPVSYADLDAFFESNGCGWQLAWGCRRRREGGSDYPREP